MSTNWNNVIGRDVKAALQDIADTERQAAEAKAIAQTAETKADEAKQTAQQAVTRADSVQTQLDTIVVEGDSSVEAAQARVNADGFAFPTLKARLDDSDGMLEMTKTSIVNLQQEVEAGNGYFNAFWKPPTLPDTIRGNGTVPAGYDPDEQLQALIDPLLTVAPDYVSKQSIGRDASDTYEIWRYDFVPQNYEKTIILTACLHGNEYTGFYALYQFLDLLVRRWKEWPHLSYLRKNVRIIAVPIANPWGHANQTRQNSNQVDLNRNFPYNWDNFSQNQPGQSNYKGPAPLSEAEAQALDTLYSEFSDAVAYLDFHTISSVTAEYVLFMPRFIEQDISRYAGVIQHLYQNGERIVWGTSTLPSATNHAANQYGMNSALPEFVNGIAGATRDSAEMTRAANWFGNLTLQAARIPARGKVEVLKNPYAKWFIYDRSRGSLFGADGNYEGTPGEQVPVNLVNHATSSTRTFSNDYAVFGSTSMKMVAANQIVNARGDYPELTTGTYWLWLLYRRVTDMQDGHFGMNLYDIGGFNNLSLVTENQTTVDPDWVRAGGVFEGRSGGARLVYGRTVAWTGTVYVDGNMLVQITEKEYNDFQDGRITLADLAARYQFLYEVSPPTIPVSSQKYSTITQMEHRFDLKAPGILTCDGYLTFTCSQQAEIAFIPQLYQLNSPTFSWEGTRDNPQAEVLRAYPAGTHTIPLTNQIFADVTNVGVSGRTGQAVVRLRAKRSGGTVTIDSYRLRVSFFPSGTGQRIEVYNASKKEGSGATAMTKTFPVLGGGENESD
jgi:hypothetical protein